MRRLRQIHLYLGSLFAPAILFFAFSGVLQTFDLHKDHHGLTRPPAWIVVLSSVHKNMRLPRPKPAEPKAPDIASASPEASEEPVHKHHGDGAGHHHHDQDDAATPASAAASTPAPAMAANPVARPADAERPSHSSLPLKIFVLAMATGLIVTTLIGLFIALKNKASRLPALVMVLIGIALPLGFLLL
jgi:hypothetical protein